MPRRKHNTDRIAAQVSKHKRSNNDEEDIVFLPTGSTLFNLVLSNRADGGFAGGRIVNLIGDSSSGKTFLALTALATIHHDGRFANYRLKYDDVEAANSFDMDALFGSAATHIEPPAIGDDGEPEYSHTMQDFLDNVLSAIDDDQPFVYVLDSFDALTSDEEEQHTSKARKARAKGKQAGGTYGTEKAKMASSILRQIKRKVKQSNSLVIVISQTRDNINPLSFIKKVRSGGRALKFYSTHEIWTAEGGKLKRKELAVGVNCRLKVTKNKVTGRVRDCILPIYYDYGVDDISSCIDWMVENKFWRKRKQTIGARGLGVSGTRDKLVRTIEERKMERKLARIVGRAWERRESAVRSRRKARFGGGA